MEVMSPATAPYPWQRDQWQQLANQIRQNRVPHAYLLSGGAGMGKSDFAVATAALLLCENPGAQACGSCRSCQLLASGGQPDLLLLEAEEGSRQLKIDQIRALTEFAVKTSHSSRRKVIIIPDADRLNPAAANALLKTLEEPVPDTVLLLTSSRAGALLPTLRSRCLRMDFPTPARALAAAWLAEQHAVENPEALLTAAGGSPLRALRMATDGSLQDRAKVFHGLHQLWLGKTGAMDLVMSLKNLEPGQVVWQLGQASTILIRHLLAADTESASANGLEAMTKLVETLAPTQRDDLLGALLALDAAHSQAQRQLAGNTNPNQLLLLQSLVWEWQQANPSR